MALRSIRSQLVIAAAFGLSFFMLLSFYISDQSERTLLKSLGESSESIAQRVIQNVDSTIYLYFQDVKSYTKNSFMLDLLEESNSAFEGLSDPDELISERDINWIEGNAEGEFQKDRILSNETSQNLRKVFVEHYEKELGHKIFEEVFITNAYGAVIAATNETSDYYQADESWWQTAKDEGEHYERIEFDESANSNVVEFSFAIEDENGEFIGVANVALGIKVIIQEAAIQLGNSQDSRLRMLTPTGDLIYSTSPYQYFSSVGHQNFWIQIEGGGSQGSFVSEEDERQKLFAYHKSEGTRSFPGYGWVIVVSSDLEGYSSILKASQDLKVTTLFTSLITILVLSLMAFFLADSIASPLTEIAKASEAIKKKKFDVKFSKKTLENVSEIGTLAQMFTSMAEDLKSFTQTLEEKIKARTSELEKEKSKDEAILNSLGENLIVIDTKGKIILHNPLTLETLGVKKLMGKTWPEVLGKKGVNKNGRKLSKTQVPVFRSMKSKKSIHSSEYSFELPNGKNLDVSINTSPVVHNGKITGGLVVFHDITQEKEIERMKDEFISLVSHQLRTPLSAMRWMSEMLLNGEVGKLNKEQKDLVLNLSLSNERMISLVNKLLHISRLESRSKEADIKANDLPKLVKKLIKEEEVQIKGKKLKISSSFHKDSKKVRVDSNLFSEAFNNLLTNAVKYTPEKGEIEIVISKKEDFFEVRVSDNGIGIPKADQEQIFEKFFRSQNAYTKDPDGAGLGLYLTKQIVEKMGGKIWFESGEDGTSFFFTIPVK